MKIFDRDDEGYVAWLKKNPTGYVLNCRKKTKYYTLHRATCKCVNNAKPTSGANWTNVYTKVCAMDKAAIEKWSQVKPKYCGTCLPKPLLRLRVPRPAEDWIKKEDQVFLFIRDTVKLFRVEGNGQRIEITDLDDVAHILAWGHTMSSKTAKGIPNRKG